MRKFITVMISAKTVFSSFLANRDPDFLSLKPSWDQDEEMKITIYVTAQLRQA